VSRSRLVFVVVVMVAMVAACSAAQSLRPSGALAGTAAASPAPSSAAASVPSGGDTSGGFDTAAAEKYCTEQGGMLVDRVATWNTNADQSAWLELAGRMRLCEFEMGEGDSTTRISVDLVTLYSEEPTLAGLAYLSKVPPTLPTNSGNPAAYNCAQGLGGATQWGNTSASGGGWVDTSQKTFVVMNLCMFADGSAIDEWGITYYADGTVRGADLATKMRYQPKGKLPAVFVPTE
jgi:hypothetical protein